MFLSSILVLALLPATRAPDRARPDLTPLAAPAVARLVPRDEGRVPVRPEPSEGYLEEGDEEEALPSCTGFSVEERGPSAPLHEPGRAPLHPSLDDGHPTSRGPPRPE